MSSAPKTFLDLTGQLIKQLLNSRVEGPTATKRTAIFAAAAACSTALLRTSGAALAESKKRRNLPIEEVKQIVARDFQQGQYYITGALSSDIFTDDALFIDPTTRVQASAAISYNFDCLLILMFAFSGCLVWLNMLILEQQHS